MAGIPSWLQRYRTLPRPVYHFAAGQFLINLINTAHFLLLNLFLQEQGLDDPAIAALGSQRFVVTLFLALPAGLWLRGRKLKMPLVAGAVLYPLSALAAIECARMGMMTGASVSFLVMGFANLLLGVASLPMNLRLVKPEQSSEALSLTFATWAAASVVGSALSALLQEMGSVDLMGMRVVLDEHATLLILTVVAFAAPLFYLRMPDPEPLKRKVKHWLHIDREDFPVLRRALFPTVCIATGAGLSIQFLNLFFSNVHDLSSKAYSAYGGVSNVLVLFAGLIVPEVKRRLGWRGAIIGVQMVAVVLLCCMGLTELVRGLAWALPVALFCFVIRQPLMSMAGPSTSDLTMQYVGERNREFISACNGAVWSGAWWLAARTFQVLRYYELPYWQVFMATCALYLVGMWAYLRLIRDMESRPEVGLERPVVHPCRRA